MSTFNQIERTHPGEVLGLYAGNSNLLLASRIARHLGIELGSSEVFEFANENIFVRILDNVREKDIFLVQPTCRPVQKSIMELLIMIDAFKRASAGRITAVVPYYSYGRSDKKDQPRVPITARLIADMISVAGADRLLTMDLHQGQIQGFFNIPVDELTAVHLLSNYWRQKGLENMVVVTDLGFAKRARTFAELLGAPLAIIEKRREANDDRARVMNVIGDVRGKRAIIVDDEVDTGGTLMMTSQALEREGAIEAYACATHGVLSDPAIDRIRDSGLREVVITDTIPLSPVAPAGQGQGALRGTAHRRGHHAHPPRRIGRGPLLRGGPAHPGHATMGRPRGAGVMTEPTLPSSTGHSTAPVLPDPVADERLGTAVEQRRLSRPVGLTPLGRSAPAEPGGGQDRPAHRRRGRAPAGRPDPAHPRGRLCHRLLGAACRQRRVRRRGSA